MEQQLKKSDKENKRLVDKIAECLEEKQDLEEALHRKDDILKTKVCYAFEDLKDILILFETAKRKILRLRGQHARQTKESAVN